MKAIKLAVSAFFHWITEETSLSERQCHGEGVSEKSRGNSISGHVQAGPGDYCFFEDSHGHHYGQMHSEGEECPGRPVKTSRSGSSHRVVVVVLLSSSFCWHGPCPGLART